MGNEAKMTETLEKAIAKDPKNIAVAFNVAKYYIEQKNFDKANLYLDRAKAIDDKNPQVIYWLGEMANEKGKYDDAISNFGRFLEIYSTLDEKVKEIDKGFYQDVLFKLGMIQLDKKKSAKNAIKYFKAAIEADSTDALSSLQLGISYYKNNEFKNAIDPIINYIKLSGNELSNLYIILSDCYNRVNDSKKAKEAYEKYDALNKQGK